MYTIYICQNSIKNSTEYQDKKMITDAELLYIFFQLY